MEMIYYFLLLFLMPSFGWIDYSGYKKRLNKVLSEQQDYEANRENYQVLYDKMCAHQKRVTIAVCAVVCLAVLGLILLSALGLLRFFA